MKATTKGYILGAIAAISYGTNPLFAVPLYDMGMQAPSVLFYRYAFATLILGLVMRLRKESFRLTMGEIPMMIGLGVMFALSSLLLFEAYNHMDVGLASTMLFVEPVFVALLLWIFFRQKTSAVTLISIGVSLMGVTLLCNPGEGAHVTPVGVVLVMASSLTYAVYMIMINKSRLRRLSGSALTFYSLLFGIIVFALRLNFFSDLQPVPSDGLAWSCVIGLSVVPTIVSLMTVAIAIQCVGSVAVSILGALEPITGLLFGVAIFGEVLTPRAVLGIIFILGSVVILVLAEPIMHYSASAFQRLAGAAHILRHSGAQRRR